MGIFRSQNAFIGGEISPRLLGRVDIASYKSSVSLLENFLIYPHGGVTTRPGLPFAWAVKNPAEIQRIIPFEVSQDTSYLIEMGVGYFRFGKYGSLAETGTLAVWDNTTTYAHGDQVSYSGAKYYSLKDDNTAHVPGVASPTFWYAMPDTVFEIPHDYTVGELMDVRYCQSVDVMWLFHPNHPVMRLERYGDADWLLVPEVFLDGPYLTINYTTTTLTPSLIGAPAAWSSGTTYAAGSLATVSGVHYYSLQGTNLNHSPATSPTWWYALPADAYVICTASALTGINNGDGFVSTDVGRHLRLYASSAWAWGEIVAVMDTTHCAILVVGGDFGTTATNKWRLGRYSETTGYPSVGTLHEARLVLCKDADVDLSKTDILPDFGVSETTEATDACNFRLLSNLTNPIRWATTSRGGLAIGSMSGEFLLTGGDKDSAIAPDSINAKQHTSIGGLSQQPVAADSVVLFVARTGHSVHEFAFVYEDDGYQAPDLSLLAEHLLRNYTVTALDYQRAASILWCVRSDGALIGLTYKRKEQVVGWHRHSTDGLFLDVACVNEGERDVPYFLVQRTVGGNTVKYVEYMAPDFITSDLKDAFIVDSGVKYSGAAVSSVSGLDHLEGRSVDVLADGKVVANKIVSGGSVTLPFAASKVSVGLHYDSDMESLPIEEVALRDGATLGRTKTVTQVFLKLYESYGCKVGSDADNLDEVIFNENQVFGEAPAPFSGDKQIFMPGTPDSEKRIYIKRTLPLPLTINALVVEWEATQR